MSARRQHWRGRPTRDVAGNLKQPMQYIPSVSRSSGVDKDGDALKDRIIQQEYRQFVQQKLDELSEQKTDNQENVLILFRKLREGIYASKRCDPFAVEVYETSLHLSILFNIPSSIPSMLPHLFSHLYLQNPSSPGQTVTILNALLHNLTAGFPSQIPYRETLADVPTALHFSDTPVYTWIKNVSQSMRTCNYSVFERLTRHDALPNPSSNTNATRALEILADRLRVRMRQRTWLVLRSAYRELNLYPEAESRTWLVRCLSSSANELDEWMEAECRSGHVRKKEGAEGRWLIVKPAR